MKPHQIDIEGLTAWMAETKVMFASSTKERKRLYCDLHGNFIVEHGGKEVWIGIYESDAVEVYNNIVSAPEEVNTEAANRRR